MTYSFLSPQTSMAETLQSNISGLSLPTPHIPIPRRRVRYLIGDLRRGNDPTWLISLLFADISASRRGSLMFYLLCTIQFAPVTNAGLCIAQLRTSGWVLPIQERCIRWTIWPRSPIYLLSVTKVTYWRPSAEPLCKYQMFPNVVR